jgi:D-alanyl-lipoteichoic acid acyltransferase DltB (MBOAT superfamily)
MLFHTVEFFWFFIVLLLLTFTLPRWALLSALLGASYVFYGFSGPGFVLLLIATSVADYVLARIFENRDARMRRIGIVLSALGNFSVLGYFKYSNFLFANANAGLGLVGIHGSLPVLALILPVGVSFYTFQSFAYTVDVLTGRIPACRSLPRFLLFVSWFPQLVAGPIMRAADLLPEVGRIEERLAGMAARVPAAAALFAEGWLRKAFADLASPSSDAFFANPGAATTAGAVYGILAFGLQIYGDFSGYTRMAQGASWIFGVRLMENFNLPYVSRSVREFWRRWHISLSTWFRDYVYIPLGGNRHGPVRTYFNLVFTMVLCGFWHGANWTFLLWGALHAAVLVGERLFERAGDWIPPFAARLLTVIFVFLAWVPFRAPDVASTWKAYGALGHGGWSLPALGLALAAAGIVLTDLYTAFVSRRMQEQLGSPAPAARRVGDWHAAGLVAACGLVWAATYVLGQNRVASFIYFQF